MKRTYSGLTLREAMQLIPAEDFTPWDISADPLPPSDVLIAHLDRLESFDLKTTEQAKTLLIDALFGEIVPKYPQLKVWKAAVLDSTDLTGIADYIVTPKRAFISTPLLCVAEAKRDDFEQGRAQCVAELVACRWANLRENHQTDVYGIVSNGQGWQFYKLTISDQILETELYTTSELPKLLGLLNYVCSECAKNID